MTSSDVLREHGIIRALPSVADIKRLDEWRRKARAIEAYLRSPELQRPILSAQRHTEARIGQLLGPAEIGANQHSGAFHHDGSRLNAYGVEAAARSWRSFASGSGCCRKRRSFRGPKERRLRRR